MEKGTGQIESIQIDPTIEVDTSGSLKFFSDPDKGEAGAKIMQFTILVPSSFPFKKPFNVVLVCHFAP